MNGVLERMAKRALGALPGVQPLTAPHFARPAVGLGASMPELEKNVEIEVPAPRAESLRPFSQQAQGLSPEPEWNREPGRDHANRGTSPTLEPMQASARGETDNVQTRGQSQQRKSDGLTPEPNPEGKPNIGNEQWLNRKPAQEPESGETSFVQPRESTTRAARTGAREDAEDETGALLRSQIEKAPAHRTLEISASESEDRPLTTALEPNRRAARRLPAPPREAAASGEKKTEIHISIGNIELRAPRVEARPQAPAFRPRVTLDDFLRRKSVGGA